MNNPDLHITRLFGSSRGNNFVKWKMCKTLILTHRDLQIQFFIAGLDTSLKPVILLEWRVREIHVHLRGQSV